MHSHSCWACSSIIYRHLHAREKLKVPIVAAVLLLRNLGIPHADKFISVLLVLAASGSPRKDVPMFRFVPKSSHYIS